MRTDPVDAAENAASVRRVPRKVLPHGPARDALLRLATAGYDVYVYQAASLNGSGIWNAWLVNRRVPLSELTLSDLDAAQSAASVEGTDA